MIADHPHLGRGWAFPPRWQLKDTAGPAVLATNAGDRKSVV